LQKRFKKRLCRKFQTPLDFVVKFQALDIIRVIADGRTFPPVGPTSGYVRATVVDAACYSLYVGIAEECYLDRFQISHRVSLLDMHAKYGLVMALAEAAEYLCTTVRPTPVFHTTPEPVGVR